MRKPYLTALLSLITSPAWAAAPSNDNIANAQTIIGSSANVEGSNSQATLEYYLSESDVLVSLVSETNKSVFGGSRSVWYRWQAPFSGNATFFLQADFAPVLEVYQTEGLAALSDLPDLPLAYNGNAAADILSGTAAFNAQAATIYYIRVSGLSPNQNGGSGNFSLDVSVTNNTVPSDNFESPKLLAGSKLTITDSNATASAQVGEPKHAKQTASRSIWFKWTAPAHGNAELSTATSGFDTVLAVYKGGTLTALTEVASNDDEKLNTTTSKLQFLTEDGAVYYIAIDGKASTSGQVVLSLDHVALKPTITQKPSKQTVFNGEIATFEIAAMGTGTVTYQWQRLAAGTGTWTNLANGQVLDPQAKDFNVTYTGADTPKLEVATVVNATLPTNNDQFRCVVTDVNGTSTSSAALLTVTLIPEFQVTIRGTLNGTIDLTNNTPPAEGVKYFAKGLPKGFTLVPETGQIVAPGIVTAKPGTYTVTYGTTTVVNGKTITSATLTFLITISPLSADLSDRFEAILEDEVTEHPVGKVELKVDSTTANYTGRVTYEADKKTFSIKGILTLDGTFKIASASAVIKRGSTELPYKLAFAIDSTNLSGPAFSCSLKQLNGDGDEVATLAGSTDGVQLANYTTQNTPAWAATYSIVLNDAVAPVVNASLDPAPQGTGYGLGKIDAKNANLAFKGYLGDGAKLTASLAPAEDASFRWYGKPYKNGGAFGGWISLSAIANGVAPYRINGVADSLLYWTKSPSSKDKSYRAGFGVLSLSATGYVWTPPAGSLATSLGLDAQTGAAAVVFTSDNLPDADLPLVPSSVRLEKTTTVLEPVANATKFTLKADLKGGFNGGFMLSDGRKATLRGALLQRPGVAAGMVVGEGYFTIPPATTGGEITTGQIQLTAP